MASRVPEAVPAGTAIGTSLIAGPMNGPMVGPASPQAPAWMPVLAPGALDPTELPAGLPPIPALLLEGDSESGRSARLPTLVPGSGAGAVWLAGCDPQTLLLGWEEPPRGAEAGSSPTEWRLRSSSDPDFTLATGPLPNDRRCLFLEAPLNAAAQVAEIGVRGPGGDWRCLATSAPVVLPMPAAGPPEGGDSSGRPAAGSEWTRPGFTGAYFENLLGDAPGEWVRAGSSESGPGPAIGQGSGRSSAAGASSPTGGPSSLAPDCAIGGPVGTDAFHFRVQAEVILHGSTEPGARVTLSGRPVALRPDGSFSIRFSLPDGRFDLPLLALSPRGAGFRRAALVLERRTALEGEVGIHPIDPALRPPGTPPGGASAGHSVTDLW